MTTFWSIFTVLLIIGLAFVVIVDNGDPGRRIGWILIIALLPVGGLIFYLLFGINKRSRKNYIRAHRRFNKVFNEQASPALRTLLFSTRRLEDILAPYRPLNKVLASGNRPSVNEVETIEIITSGSRKYELLMEDIKNAKESIHIEYFKFGNDEGGKAVKQALMQKAREGVKVRFIKENIANIPIPYWYFNSMRRAGVEVVNFTNYSFSPLRFLSTLSYRDHRKIAVIDGRIGYTGGMNISDKYFRRWRDTHIRFTGSAVAQLQYAFLDTWVNCRGKLATPLLSFFPMLNDKAEGSNADTLPAKPLIQIATGDPSSPVPAIHISYEWALLNAKKYVWIQTPYLAPPESFLRAIQAASAAGVDVRIMVPKKNDTAIMRPINKAYYMLCLEAGARVFLRGGEFIHSKTLLMDDYLSMIGSSNLDNRSFDIDYEINTYMFDSGLATRNKEIFEQDLALSSELDLNTLRREPWWKRGWYRIMRLIAPVV